MAPKQETIINRFFKIFHRKCLKMGTETEGKKVNFSGFFSLGHILGPKVSPWSSRVTPKVNFSRLERNLGIVVVVVFLMILVRFVCNKCNRQYLFSWFWVRFS